MRTSEAQNQLVKFGLRWYLTAVGSWTQQDTLDSPLDPANADRYAYAGSDPVDGADPDGNESEFGEYAGHCLVDGSVGLGVGGVPGGPLGAGIGFAIGCGVGAFSYYAESHGASEVGETVDGVEDLRELQEISEWLNE